MKKLLFLSCLFYTSQSFSQEKKVHWGYKFGLATTGASASVTEISKITNAFGFCAGIFADIRIGSNEDFFIRPTVQLIKTGSNIEFKNTKLNPSVAVRELGISFPLGLIYRIDEEIEFGIGAISTIWFDSNLGSDVQTTTGFHALLGYKFNEKNSLQLNYSLETKAQGLYKRNALGISLLGYF
jgi:hypothetical protein